VEDAPKVLGHAFISKWAIGARASGGHHGWGGYEIKVYLFACWKLYSILRTFTPGPKNLFANKLFSFFAATMAWSGVGPYHGMWHEYAQTKCIGAILIPWAMTIALR